jgi:hypothetical protein
MLQAILSQIGKACEINKEERITLQFWKKPSINPHRFSLLSIGISNVHKGGEFTTTKISLWPTYVKEPTLEFFNFNEELDDICSLVITIQSRLSTLASQVLSVLEFNVNQRQSFQALNDEVDALRSQLEEIFLQPTLQEPQENVVVDTESTNSSPRVSPFPDLNITV